MLVQLKGDNICVFLTLDY